MASTATSRVAFRTCPLCEAGCGLEIELVAAADGRETVRRIRGDLADVFSHGYVCPKGSTLRQLHEDPDRLRRPLVKRDGVHVEVSWDEAFAEIERRWQPIVAAHGREATAIYLGNPTAHVLDTLVYNKVVLRAMATPNIYSASTVDQRPKELASGYLFGLAGTIAVPDIDRTDHLLLLGANPLASNGSLATAPDWPGRLAAIRARGGRVVVVDPRRSETAEVADEHVALRPGTDALLLAAMATTLFEEGLVRLRHLEGLVVGVEAVREALAPFTPELVARRCGIEAATIRRLARDLAAAASGVVYGRIGTCTQAFGTTASWLVDVLNVLTGNLDRPGGAMFTTPAAGSPNLRGTPRVGRGMAPPRRRSRVSGLPITLGETPVCGLAEEIETDGPGQVRALLVIGGNPVVSTPNGGGRLDRALEGLECMVSVDIYLNETSRHADVILPPPSALQKSHYDLGLLPLAVRNVANYSPAVLPLDDGQPAEWEILARLALLLRGAGPDGDPAVLDDELASKFVTNVVADPDGPWAGRDPDDVLAELGDRRGPERQLDLLLRTGPYGLSLDDLLAAPHGIDLGPLQPRLPDALRTPSGMVELAPAPLLADVERLRASLDEPDDTLVLVGRRHVRSNNSWLHNIEVLVKGRPRCTLQLHPDDAAAAGIAHGDAVVVRSRTGEVTVAAEVSTVVRPGVVSLPHGWGHDVEGTRLTVAATRPGVNSNLLADERSFDPLSGNAVLNGIPVEVRPAAAVHTAAADAVA